MVLNRHNMNSIVSNGFALTLLIFESKLFDEKCAFHDLRNNIYLKNVPIEIAGQYA